MHQKMFQKIVVVCCGCLLVVTANAETITLATLLTRAQQSEPVYLAAKTDVAVADARIDQAFGRMLPQISATGSVNTNDRDYYTRNSYIGREKDKYNNHTAQVSLTQPIWNYGNIVAWRQSHAVAEQARYQLSGAGQELFSKLVVAWFDVLAARDALVFAEQQESAWRFHWKTTARAGELGDKGLHEVSQARAKLDQAIADLTTAQTDVQVKRAALEQIVGTLEEFEVPFVRADAQLANPDSETLESWLKLVEQGSPQLMAATRAYEAATSEIKKQRAEHYPKLDLTASYGKNSQQVGGFPGQDGYDIKTGVVGLQLTIPIFSGGTTNAKVNEAIAQQEKARLELESARRATVVAAKQAWFSWIGARTRAQAGLQSVEAAQLYLKQATVGKKTGLSGQYEVMQAEQQLRMGERDYRKARYDQIVSYVRLKATAGMLTAEDVMALDTLLSPINETPPAVAPESKPIVEAKPVAELRKLNTSPHIGE